MRRRPKDRARHHARARREAGLEELAMTEMNAPTVTATEVVLPGKVEPSGLRLVERAQNPDCGIRVH